MILALLSTLLLAASGPIAGNPASADTGNYGTGDEAVIADTLSEAVLVSGYKQVLPLERIASPVTEVSLAQMESRGIIGSFDGAKPRQLLISKSDWQEIKARRSY